MAKAIAIVLVVVLVGVGVWWIVYARNNSTETASETPTTTGQQAVSYTCDGGKTIAATYTEGASTNTSTTTGEMPTPTGSVFLALSDGRELTLPQTISASGIRYANEGESIVFWSKGSGAFMTENGQETYSNCVQVTL